MKKFFLVMIVVWLLPYKILSHAAAGTDRSQEQPLPVEHAFQLSATLFGPETILLNWKMPKGYYLYQNRFHFNIVSSSTHLGRVLFPPGQIKKSSGVPLSVVYENQVTLSLPVIRSSSQEESVELTIQYQGCYQDHYCYPPTAQRALVHFRTHTITLSDLKENSFSGKGTTISIEKHLFHHSALGLWLIFFGFGLLLSLTPCVFPMLPILSGMIIGHQKTALKEKSFFLSVIYVMSMALTYAAGGVLAAWLGKGLHAFFQKPIVIAGLSALFVGLALSFFGLYRIQLPTRFEASLHHVLKGVKSGHYIGVAIMGCVSSLIVSPCVTPGLVGAFTYMSQTGDLWMGGMVLFCMGLGMGFPLLILGWVGHKVLPKAGQWMKSVEHVCGVVFLSVAIWMVSRILPGSIILLLWAVLWIGCAVFLESFSRPPAGKIGKLKQCVGILLFIYGLLLAVGAAQGNDDPFQPLASAKEGKGMLFSSGNILKVTRLSMLTPLLKQAQAEKKPVLLIFYAKWCASCQTMERAIQQDPLLLRTLNHFQIIQADITELDEGNKALMTAFHVIAPPTVFVFNAQGILLENLTRVGEMDTQTLNDLLKESAR